MSCLRGNIGKDENNARLYDLGLAKSSFGFFDYILWEDPNELIDQLNNSVSPVPGTVSGTYKLPNKIY